MHEGGGNPYAGAGMSNGLSPLQGSLSATGGAEKKFGAAPSMEAPSKFIGAIGALAQCTALENVFGIFKGGPSPTPFAGNIAGVISSKSR